MTTDLVPSDGTEDVRVEGEATPGTLPYMSFPGLRNLLQRLHDHGVPQVFDKSFFGNVSGSLTAQIRVTLRFFELIDEEKRPTSALRELAAADEQRRVEILRDLAQKHYADAIKLGEDNGTNGQLAEVFRARGLSGDTITKAITFYLGLADYVGLPVSPFFKRGRPTSNGTAARRPVRKRRTPSAAPPSVVESPPANPPVSTTEAQKSAYVEMLMELARKTDDGPPPSDLLDRIERALGMASGPQGGGA